MGVNVTASLYERLSKATTRAKELFRSERDCQDVIDSPVEGGEFGAQITASGERNRRQARVARSGSHTLHELLAIKIGIEDHKVRLPVIQNSRRSAHGRGCPGHIDAMVERQFDHLNGCGSVEHDQQANRAAWRPLGGALLALSRGPTRRRHDFTV